MIFYKCHSDMTMVINALRNRCYGPGGGTRHLHHKENTQERITERLCADKFFSLGVK